ncbi:MAG: heat-inducible transcription repressor HrcA [Eubacterium sp.]|nr:heat-inducible transcription repressor HrcA [Eubacterium sp.]
MVMELEHNEMLDDRKEKILKAIIANYLETGEPVGSRTISKFTDLNLSSATIRNEMADLEEMGYLVQPHTSAGRIPTDKGYRFYVDSMTVERDKEEESRGALLERVDKLESLLKQVAKVLAFNTQYATMVSTPQLRNRQVKFIQLSQVDDEDLVAVIVVGDNVAKNRLIHVSRPLSNEEVLKLNLLLNTFLTGASLNEINIELMQAMRRQAGEYEDILENIFEGIVDAVHQAEELQIYTSGTSNILKYGELGDVQKATALLETLEDKSGLESLIDETMKQDQKSGDGIQIYIGEEAPVQNMKDYSIVTSTYELPEGAKGTIGIIGPKRMDYKKVVQTLKDLTDELDSIFRKNEKKE